MPILHIDPTPSSPLVHFDDAAGILELSGESYPENSFDFYAPLISWIEEYLKPEDQKPLVFNVFLNYLNTSSTKSMIDILDRLQEAHEAGASITVRWHYDEENDRALDAAEEFKEDFTFPFAIIPVSV